MKDKTPLAAGLIALAVLLAATWPVAIHPASWSVGASGNDVHSVSWSLHHAAWSLAHLQLPVGHTDRILFPDGGHLVVAAWPQGMLLAPVTWLAGAVASFNALQVLNLVLAAALGAWCARRMGAGVPGAAIVALGTAASPAVLATAFNQNPDVTAAWGLPLAAGLAWQCSRRGALVAGLAVGLVAWMSPYFGFMAGLAALAFVPWRWDRLLALASGALVLGLPLVLVVSPSLGQGGATHKPLGLASTPLLWLVDPRTHVLTDHNWLGARVAEGAYLGLTLVALAAAGWGRGVPRRRWVALLAVAVVLALGPSLALLGRGTTGIPLPAALVEHLPGLGQLRITSRFTALGVFALALAAGTSLREGRWWRWAGVVVAADLLLLGGGLSMVRAAPVPLSSACHAVEVVDGPAVLVPRDSHDAALLLATCHGQPAGEGLKGSASPQVRRATRLPTQEMIHRLRGVGVHWLLVVDGPRSEEIRRHLAPCEVRRGGGVSAHLLRGCTGDTL